MPTADRRPRRRLKPKETTPETLHGFYEQARNATPEDWDNGLRRRFVRFLVDRGHKQEEAAGIVRAYERKPHFIPMPPPKGFQH